MTRISALGALGAAPASGDLVAVVDVSDTTQAASGTTKRVTIAELLASLVVGAVALVAGSATVSTAAVQSTSKIFLTRGLTGGVIGDLRISTITPGVSFVIASASNLDTSTVNWLVV